MCSSGAVRAGAYNTDPPNTEAKSFKRTPRPFSRKVEFLKPGPSGHPHRLVLRRHLGVIDDENLDWRFRRLQL